jgi:DNA-binding CsgD family transcriptional regulator/tetratricopeptide (TPR) repeat protein
VTRVVVEPLTPSVLHQLVRNRYGLTLSRPALLRLHRETRGNPYVALQVVRATVEQGGDLSSPGPLPVPADVRALLHRRLASTSDEVREILAFSALLGDPTTPAIEAAIGDRERARRDLMAASREDLLVVEAERIRFSHPLLASAVRSTLGPDETLRLHHRLADVSGDLEARALHLALATTDPDEGIATTLEEAGDAAARRAAHERAAQLFEHATRLTPDYLGEPYVRRTLSASRQHYHGGNGRTAAALVKELIAVLPRGKHRAAALEALADVEISDSLVDHYEQALDEVGEDAARRASIHLGMGMALGTQGQFEGWLSNLGEAARLARTAGEHSLASLCLAELGLVRFANGDGVQRGLHEEALREEALADGGNSMGLAPEWSLGRQLAHAGEVEEGRPLLERALERSREYGSAESEMGTLMILGELELNAGRWSQADRYSGEALEIAEQIQISNGETQCLFFRSLVEAHIGALDEALRHATRGSRLGHTTGDLHYEMANEAVLGFVALTRGDLAEARRHLAPLPDLIRVVGPRDPQHFPVRGLAAESLILAGDLAAVEHEIDELEDVASLSDHTWARGSAARCRALLLSSRGEVRPALAASESAIELHERVDLPFELARSLLVHGLVQRRAKLKRPARESFERAASIFGELGAQLWADRARTELSRIGGRQPGSKQGLTATERSVAELAAAGRLNKQIARELNVSERTVEANLTKVYRKLGLRSRSELASAWRK